VHGWEVIDGEITSDHRLIRYTIGKEESFRKLKCKIRYVTDQADWEKFNAELVLQLSIVDDDLTFADLEDRTELLMQAISKAADKAIPKRKVRIKQNPPWWTRELNEQRKKMNTAYRKININSEERQRYRREYNTERNSFVKLLRKEKESTWRRFAGELNDNH